VEVVVNVPSGRLELMVGDSLVRSYPVSVGSARYPTPVGDYLLATVIWNPWWRPPPESDWARNRRPEPPGPNNPMGRVKLHMDELIFIHGTTSEGRLGAPASHGCIRMSNPDVVDLAKRLNRIADPGIDAARLDSVSAVGRQERHTVMARSIRMRVSYEVAQARGGRIHVYPDVYGRAGADYAARVRRTLASAGVDTAQVPAAAMARLRQSATRGARRSPSRTCRRCARCRRSPRARRGRDCWGGRWASPRRRTPPPPSSRRSRKWPRWRRTRTRTSRRRTTAPDRTSLRRHSQPRARHPACCHPAGATSSSAPPSPDTGATG
jgi:hypothetical protein